VYLKEHPDLNPSSIRIYLYHFYIPVDKVYDVKALIEDNDI
jgi:hypothetical protein